MPSRTQGQLLPPGWKVSDEIKNEVSAFKYHLNDMATLAKLKKQAVPTPMKQLETLDNSVTLQFSTGAYITAVSPLIKFYKRCVGRRPIQKKDVDGLEVIVTSVTTTTDAGGKITGYLAELQVDGQKVMLTAFDTTVKVRVQGRDKQEEYTRRALLPYLENEIKKHASKIEEINQQVLRIGNSAGKSRNTAKNMNVIPVEKDSDNDSETENEIEPDETIPQDDLQLNDSILILSTLHPPDYCGTPPAPPLMLGLEKLPARRLELPDY